MVRLSSSAARYGGAIAATALASLLYFVSGPVELDSDLHYFGFVLAVFAAALAGGLGPGLVATALSVSASAYLLLPPIYSLQVSSQDQLQRLILFCSEGILLSCVGQIFRDSDTSDRGSAWALRYPPVLLFVLTATGLKLLAFRDVEHALPFTFFYVAIAASAWIGGVGPGLAATLLSAAAAEWLFVTPQSSAPLLTPANTARIFLFVLEGSLLTGLSAAYPRARRLANKAIEQMRLYSEHVHRGKQDIRALRLTSKDLIWEWDPGSDRVVIGATETERPETPAATMTFSSWLQLVHPEDRSSVAASLNAALIENRDDWVHEYRRLRSGQESAYVSDHAYVIRDVHGKPIRVIGRSVDVTESKQVARSYGAESSYRTVFEQSPLAILVTDDALHISSANHAASEILGYSDLQFKEMHLEKLFEVHRRESVLQMFLQLSRRRHASLVFHEKCIRAGGDRFEAKINVATLAGTDHGLNGWVIMIEEVD